MKIRGNVGVADRKLKKKGDDAVGGGSSESKEKMNAEARKERKKNV